MLAVVLDPPHESKETMHVREVPDPKPAPGEVVVSVASAGLNFADLMMRKGTYPHPKGYPLVAGLEMAGRIAEVGEGVTGIAVGDRVAAFSEDAGAFAERCAVSADRVLRIPDSMSFDVASAFYIQGLTAWHLLHTVSTTKPGDVVLIHAIGGGVGLYLTQIAKQAGATVIGTIGTKGKEKRAIEYGADHVIDRNEEDFVAAVMGATSGRGVDKIVDSTGGSILDRSFEVIRELGHVVSYGEAEGKPYANLWERLVRKSLTFSRLHLGHIDCRSDAWKKGAREVVARIRAGSLQVPIEAVFPMSGVHDMYARLESRTVAGKLLLQVG